MVEKTENKPKTQPQPEKNKGGRPTKKEAWKAALSKSHSKMTPELINKLKQAFAIGATVQQACDYAEIGERTYYRWVEKNPVLGQEFERMRQKLPLKAKQNIAGAIHQGDVPLSERYLSKTEPEVYADTIKVKGDKLELGNETPEEDLAVIDEMHARLKSNIRKRIMSKPDPNEKN